MAAMKKRRGLLIVLEGLDGVGKTTHGEMLRESVLSHSILISFPYRISPIGEVISKFLKKEIEVPSVQAMHLLFSANRWEMQESIGNALKEGTDVLCDRYSPSGIAYSAAQGACWHWCTDTERGLIQPDLVIYLQGQHVAKAEERYETKEMQESVAEEYATLIKPNWFIVDNRGTIEEVNRSISAIIERERDRLSNLPLFLT